MDVFDSLRGFGGRGFVGFDSFLSGSCYFMPNRYRETPGLWTGYSSGPCLGC